MGKVMQVCSSITYHLTRISVPATVVTHLRVKLWLLSCLSLASLTACEPGLPEFTLLPGSQNGGQIELRIGSSQNFKPKFLESESVNIAFELSTPTTKELSFTWNLVQSSGGGLDNDFIALTGELIVAKNQSTVSLNLPLIDDAIFEGPESYEIKITTTTDSEEIDTTKAVLEIQIEDNEVLPTVSFESGLSVFHEGHGIAQVKVLLSVVTEVAVMANYSLTGSALIGSGKDFLHQPITFGEALIPGGQNEINLNFDLLPDLLADMNKSIQVNLHNTFIASLPAGPVGAIDTHNLTILDVDGPLTVLIEEVPPGQSIYTTLPIHFDIIFNRKIDTSATNLTSAEVNFIGTVTGIAATVANGTGADEDLKFRLSVTSIATDGSVEPSIAAGSLVALVGGLTNTSSTGTAVIYDATTPLNPTGWTLSKPLANTIANEIRPEITGTGITNEDGSSVAAFLDSNCSTVVGSAVIAGGAFLISNILLDAGGANDGLVEFYGQVTDVANHKSGCVDLVQPYTLNQLLPTAPTNLKAFTGPSQITLTWDTCSSCTYELYYDTNPTVTTSSNKIGGIISPPFIHNGLTNQTLYHYRVLAVDTVGSSALSSVVDTMPYINFCNVGGDLSSNCTISGPILLPSGIKLSLDTNLTLASGGDLFNYVSTNIIVSNAKNIVIENGGFINIHFASLSAPRLDIRNAGSFTGDVQNLVLDELIVAGLMKTNIYNSQIGNLEIKAGGELTASARGHASNSGPGSSGNTGSNGYPGAAHGGTGGVSGDGTMGGNTYGLKLYPIDFGSGGSSNGSFPTNSGGGALKLFIKHSLLNFGTISAKGGSASSYSGGGSGGSIWIDVGVALSGGLGELEGDGLVIASGGAGSQSLGKNGGGGGGGRVAIYASNYNYRGAVNVSGGNGSGGNSTPGTDGTFYQNVLNMDSLCDSGSFAANNCELSSPLSLGNEFFLTGSSYSIRNGGSIKGNFTIDLTGDLNIDSGASISAENMIANTGQIGQPGASNLGAGGGYGGVGGKSNTIGTNGGATYGNPLGPINSGSIGGGPGGKSGGALKIIVNGAFTNDGVVSVNGSSEIASTGAGGGSGGSIWIDLGSSGGAGLLTGTGTFTAIGGPGKPGLSLRRGGGGGGGRIAIYSKQFKFKGDVATQGGNGSGLTSSNGDQGSYYLAITNLDSLCDSGKFTSVCTITSAVQLPNQFSITGASLVLGSGAQLKGNILLDLSQDLTINSGAIISAESATGSLPGTPADFEFGGGGGGHGGEGGKSGTAFLSGGGGGPIHGSLTNPTSQGAHGAGINYGKGGGALKIIVGGTFRLDGIISADGGNGFGTDGAGGGAGGSLWIDVGITNTGGSGVLTGSGEITAQGGQGYAINSTLGGGGGGGRIAIFSKQYKYRGQVKINGGSGSGNFSTSGSDGSFYQEVSDLNSLCDSGAMPTDNCFLNSYLPLGNDFIFSGSSLTMNAAAIIEGNIEINLTGDLTITPGATIMARKTLRKQESGNAGVFLGGGGGGGHGARGGRVQPAPNEGSPYGNAIQPITYGGSDYSQGGGRGGGALKIIIAGTLTNNGIISANGGTATNSGGGGAGGSLWIDVGITNTGSSGTLAGNGSFSATGGMGSIIFSSRGGSGGGGRILILSNDYFYRGNISVAGGSAIHPYAEAGATGSFEHRITNPNSLCDQGTFATTCEINSQIPVGNGLNFSGATLVNLTIGDGIAPAGLNAIAPTSDTKLTLAGTLSILFQGYISLNFTKLEATTLNIDGTLEGNIMTSKFADINIANSGRLIANGRGHQGQTGSRPGLGLGGGLSNGVSGGGGGYAGNGGDGLTNNTGGNEYGSLQLPIQFGSAGGAGTLSGKGGSGGGLLYLNVSNTLTINGIISANGRMPNISGPTSGAPGGGSGGAIWIAANTLTNLGQLQANGANGILNGIYAGGGGSGGRITIYADTITPASSPQANKGLSGGATAQDGSTGTIYTLSDQSKSPQLAIVTSTKYTGDLGGQPGADAKCNALMKTTGIGREWTALLSDDNRDAINNITISSPVLNFNPDINGGPATIANNTAEFWSGTLTSPILKDELGSDNYNLAWTGSFGLTPNTGTATPNNCNNWTSSNTTSYGIAGQPDQSDENWLARDTVGCATSNTLYCISK